MERFCFAMRIKPGAEEEYERRHDELWPELAAAIADAGISNYSLFRRGLQVIGYCECEPDARTALARISSTDVDRRWSQSMAHLMDEEVGEDGELVAFAELWHLA
jgi:L-rhamnose mutarotase